MTDAGNSSGPDVRLSNAERDEAVARLNANQREGRLSEAEFAERSAAVRVAVTRADLAPIFSDLPSDRDGATGGYPASAAYPTASPSASAPAAAPPKWIENPGGPDGPPSGRSPGLLIVSLAPLVALVLFFVTSALFGWEWSWLWFILVPVVGVIVYGGGWSNRSRR